MPKLLVFAPCRVGLVDQNNALAVIGVFSELVIDAPESHIDADAVVALHWDLVTQWFREPSEEQKQFVQHYELVGPNRKVSLGSAKFSIPQRLHQTVNSMNGFPVLGAGEYQLRLLLREDVEGAESREVAWFPIQVRFTQPG